MLLTAKLSTLSAMPKAYLHENKLLFHINVQKFVALKCPSDKVHTIRVRVVKRRSNDNYARVKSAPYHFETTPTLQLIHRLRHMSIASLQHQVLPLAVNIFLYNKNVLELQKDGNAILYSLVEEGLIYPINKKYSD